LPSSLAESFDGVFQSRLLLFFERKSSIHQSQEKSLDFGGIKIEYDEEKSLCFSSFEREQQETLRDLY